MNSERYFQEICRRVKPYNIETEGLKENGSMYFSYAGESLCRVSPDGITYHFSEHLDTEEKKELCSLMTEISEEARVYVQSVEHTPPLKAVDLRDGYKLLCEHGNIVLAGRDMGEYGYEFVTWQYTYDRKSVTLGHYYHNDYAGAKEDFAVRSGLVSEQKMFENEELQAIYSVLDQGQKYIPYPTFYQEQKIIELKQKIERMAPKAVEAFRAEQESQRQKPVFLFEIIAGDLIEDALKVHKNPDGGLSVYELYLPAKAEELQEAYDFRTENGNCYHTVESIRYPNMINDMTVTDLECLNDAAKMIGQMGEEEIAELQLNLRNHSPENETQLKELCENIYGPLFSLHNSLNML